MEETSRRKFPKVAAGARSWAFVVFLAVSYFWYQSGPLELPHFWTGEMRTAAAARGGDILRALDYSIANDPGGVVYNVFAALAVRMGGAGDPVMRIPALVFGALCFPVFFILLRRLAPDGLSIISLMFLFASPSFLFASMNARGQSLFILLGLLIFILALMSGEEWTPRRRIAAVLIFTLALYTDFRAMILLAGGAGVCAYAASGGEGKRGGAVPAEFKTYLLCAFLALALFIPGFFLILRESAVQTGMKFPAGGGDVFPYFKRLLIVYAALAGGLTGSNTSLAAAMLLPVVYGAVKLFYARRKSFAAILIWFIVILSACAVSAASRPDNSPVRLLNVAMPLIPFVSFFAAASIYYFTVAAFKRDHAAIFSVFMFVRIVLTGFVLLLSFFASAFFIVKAGAETHRYERQNWKAAFDSISKRAKPGDTLVVQSSDSIVLDYYRDKVDAKLLRAVKAKDAEEIDLTLVSSPRTWVLVKEPKVLGVREKPYVENLYEMNRNTSRFGGMLGDIHLSLIDGYAVEDESRFEIFRGTPKEEHESGGIIPIYCGAEDSAHCAFSVYATGKDEYEFEILVSAGTAPYTGETIEICGERAVLSAINAGMKQIAWRRPALKPGACNIEFMSPSTGGEETMQITVRKKTPFSLAAPRKM